MAASVLVVDDDPDIRCALADVLTDEGFDVREAANGAEALESIALDEPAIILLDLWMPVMNGWEVMQALRRSGHEIPVVVLSAANGEGCANFVQKPITLERLLSILEKIRTPSMCLRAAPRAV